MGARAMGAKARRRVATGSVVLAALVSGCIASTTPTGLDGGGGGGGASGTVEISVTTSGVNVDPNGYQLLFNELSAQPVGANGSVTFSLLVGSYQVTLADVASNCEVEGGSNAQPFSVSEGATTMVDFEVSCT